MCGTKWYHAVSATAAIILLSFVPLPASAQVGFNLPAEPLAQALRELAIQGDLNVYFDPSAVAGIEAPALKADLTPRAAFSRVLSGTNFVAVYVDEDTIRVVSRTEAQKGKQGKQGANATRVAAGETARHAAKTATHKDPQAGSDPPQADTLTTGNTRPLYSLRTILVTAQRYAAQPVYDVPISLTVLSRGEMLAQGDANLSSMQFFVPELTVEDTRAYSRIFIGGVANSSGQGGLVSEYIDDADVTASPSLFGYNDQDLTTYDLKRVEVLLGPQGTLYGEGAEGGAVHYVTNSPDLSKYEFGLGGEYLFTVGGTPTQRLFPVVNIPVANGTAAIRIAGQYAHEGGWIDEPAANLKGINSADVADTRLEALWRPIHKLSFKLLSIFQNENFGPNLGEGSSGNFSPIFGILTPPRGYTHYYIGNFEVTYTPPVVGTITSSTTYYTDTQIDYHFVALNLGFGPDGQLNVPQSQFNRPLNDYRYHHYSEEIRLHNAIGLLQYTFGAFYKQVRVNNIPSDACSGPLGVTLSSDEPSVEIADPQVGCFPFGQDLRSRSWSGFADVQYEVAHRLSIEAGVRTFTDTQRNFSVGNPGPQGATFKSTDPQFSVLYKTHLHMNVYADVRRGFRSGGFNGFNQPTFGPEDVWWYAAGVKTRETQKFSGSMELHFARYSNFQVFGQVSVPTSSGIPVQLSITNNGGIVHIKGGTAQFMWHPVSSWTFGINGDYENSRFVSILPGDSNYSTGDPLDFVPRYKVAASIQNDFNVVERPAFVRLDYSQRAPVTDRFRGFGIYAVSDHIYLMNVTVGMRWNDSLNFGVLAQNILNDRAVVDGQLSQQSKTQPMSIGVYMDTQF